LFAPEVPNAWPTEAMMHSKNSSTAVTIITNLFILVLSGLLIIIQEPMAVGG
jgi:hypothetical protein